MGLRIWLLLVTLLAASVAWTAEPQSRDESRDDIRELFAIMGLRQYFDSAGPQLEAAAQSNVDKVIAKLGARALSKEQRAILDDARKQLVSMGKDSLLAFEAQWIEAFERVLSQEEFGLLLGFARSEVGREVFKGLFQARSEGRQFRASALTPSQAEALREWAQKPGFPGLIEKFPEITQQLGQSNEAVEEALRSKMARLADDVVTKLQLDTSTESL